MHCCLLASLPHVVATVDEGSVYVVGLRDGSHTPQGEKVTPPPPQEQNGPVSSLLAVVLSALLTQTFIA